MRKYIKLSAITVAADRQRKEFKQDELHALAESIQTKGLFHPIVLRVTGDAYTLVAGERRLRAVTDLWALGVNFNYDGEPVPTDSIPYSSLADLSELELEEAELEENIQRTQLTWQEKAAAHAKLHTLRSKQATLLGAPAHTVAATALEVRGSSEGIHQETTRREIILAAHLGNPLVQAAKTAEEAFKILRKAETQQQHRELGASVGRTFTADFHQVLNTDSLVWMQQATEKQFDVILTDSPYGMGADTFGDSGGVAAGAHGYSDTPELYESILQVCEKELYRLAKDQAHMYWFCDLDKFIDTRERFRAAGWQVFRTPLIWYKRAGMRAPWPEHGPQRKYEVILYAVKGKRPILKMLGDVLEYTADSNLGHAAQKPVALLQDLLSRSALPGNIVFDPFAGSGTTLAAAHNMKCVTVSIELDPSSYGIIIQRVKALKAQQELDLEIGV